MTRRNRSRRAFSLFLIALAISAAAGSTIVARGRSADVRTVPLPTPVELMPDDAGMAAGPSTAGVTVQVIGAYECPQCRVLDSVVGRRIREMAAAGHARYIYVHALFDRYRNGAAAAAATVCADRQQRGWVMHELLQRRIETWSESDDPLPALLTLGDSARVDRTAFASCLVDPATRRRLESDREARRLVRADLVPFVIVNGERVLFGGSLSRLTRHIESLAQRSTSARAEAAGGVSP